MNRHKRVGKALREYLREPTERTVNGLPVLRLKNGRALVIEHGVVGGWKVSLLGVSQLGQTLTEAGTAPTFVALVDLVLELGR